MNTENTDSRDDLFLENEKRKASSLKSLSTSEIEKVIATTLTELLDWNHEVKISNIHFTKVGDVEISLEVRQTFYQKKE